MQDSPEAQGESGSDTSADVGTTHHLADVADAGVEDALKEPRAGSLRTTEEAINCVIAEGLGSI